MRMPEPIIYPAVADKVGPLQSPQNVVAFYMRIVEVCTMIVPTIADDPRSQEANLTEKNIRIVVEAWIDILHLARWIIEHARYSQDFDEAVRQRILADIASQTQIAKLEFKIGD